MTPIRVGALHEFSPTKKIPGPMKAIVYKNNDSPYDLIISMDMLQLLGIDINTSTKTGSWDRNTISFQPPSYLRDGLFTHSIFDLDNPEEKAAADAGYESETILNARTVVEQQTHHTKEQQDDLCATLSKYSKLFQAN